ncbi:MULTISPECIES: ABC transporter substrate-binding protein [Tenacibaculum]|uniref:ABC transporter substrate-binding protein n=1 Tax=Tenacibaculum TaxID=104267 RepID=UPI001F0B4A5B|nr:MULTISPECIES: ABC transporter substrate-binding protein [Tenacibaculum]MCH3883199.1 ABC transporter substrate-binding protein [Tenacibaculum aquimarinum]MDO6600956.1 ABC transporter substrate-binding protein [Tenacibaculum sp. 1_MG-2023]
MSLRNKFLVFSFQFLVTCFAFFSCVKKEHKFKDTQVFRYNEHSNITSLDPAFAKDQRNIWAVNQLYNGLVQLDDSLQVKPDIAKSWSISEDGKTYTFLLRKDVKFHKHKLFGKDSIKTVNATDFEYSFNRLLDKKVASPGGWVLQNVANFKAENDSTFVIQLKQPFPPFLGLLAMKYCSVVPKEAVEYFGNTFRANPIGTGPFQFKLWVENTKLVLRKNQIYFEKDENGIQLPYLEAVAVTFLPDKQSEFLQFIQGNLDFMKSLDASYKDDILNTDGTLKEKYTSSIFMETGAYLNTEYLGIYLEGEENYPTKSKLIRQAINYGFDREKMIKFLRNGIGTPALNGFIPKGLPSFNNQKGYSYQPKKAKELVAQFKNETGNTEPEITITTNSNYLDLCEFIQRELQNISLKTNVDVIPPSTLRQGKANGKLPIFRASWIADYPDAENYVSLFYSKNFTPNGPNYTHFKNDLFDTLYEQSISEVNNNKRYKLYQKMDSIIIAEAPIVPLYYDEVIRFSQKNVKNLGINPIDLLNLKRVSKN